MKQNLKNGFSLIELVFVIVVMGILAKFGVEFLAQSYNNYLFSKINSKLQEDAQTAVEQIASHLQYRIKPSAIGRKSSSFASFLPVGDQNIDSSYNILEWVGYDSEGFRGDNLNTPYWSGVIDLDLSDKDALFSPATDTSKIDTLIKSLSHNNSSINDAALYFVGSNSDILSGYGWDGNAITTQSAVMHPIKKDANTSKFIPVNGGTGAVNSFANIDVYEYYQLAWSAYAVGMNDYDAATHKGTLRLWYDYQPWRGEKYTDGKSVILSNNVSTFRFNAVGDVMKIQVCVKSDLVQDQEYSICKEKTIF